MTIPAMRAPVGQDGSASHHIQMDRMLPGPVLAFVAGPLVAAWIAGTVSHLAPCMPFMMVLEA
jgi:hypothetical protein